MMSENKITKSVFIGLHKWHRQGFPTWISRVCELAEYYDIDLEGIREMTTDKFKAHCSEIVKQAFKNKWTADVNNNQSRILKTYVSYKTEFRTESYLDCIYVPRRFRIALSKLRSSSHNLEIERGRYVRPNKDVDERVCLLCNVVDNEIHFVTNCCINERERLVLYQKLDTTVPEFTLLSDRDKFVYLMGNRNENVMTWFAKFVHLSFHVRNEKLYGL